MTRNRTKQLGDLTWSWDFRDLRDRGVSTEEIFEANYPPRIDIKKIRKSIDKAVRESAKRMPARKGKLTRGR